MKQKFSALLVLLLIISTPLFSQNNEESEKKSKDIISLLFKKKMISQEEHDSIATTRTGFKPSVEAHAMAHLAYKWTDYQNPNNTFSLERAFVFANARLAPKIDMFGLYYFAPSAVNMIHEFWARYKVLPEFGIRVGLMKVPFSFENLVPTTNLHTIDFSQSVESLAGVTTDVIGTNVGRDAGIEVFGELLKKQNHYLLYYNAGVYNGSGVRTLKDNNSAKDFAFSVGVQPLKGWKVGGSAIFGCATYESVADKIAFGDHVRNRWSFGTQYDIKNFYARFEYLRGQDAHIDRHGFYALGIFRAFKKVDFTAAYDWYNRDMASDTNISVRYNIGFSYWFNTLCKLQTFYTFTDKPNMGIKENRFMTQLQVGF